MDREKEKGEEQKALVSGHGNQKVTAGPLP